MEAMERGVNGWAVCACPRCYAATIRPSPPVRDPFTPHFALTIPRSERNRETTITEDVMLRYRGGEHPKGSVEQAAVDP